jgi:hypothetical protein
MPKRIYGSPGGLFGDYEWAKLLHVATLVYMLLAALATWAITYVAPVVEGWGGVWVTVVGIVVPIIRAWLLKQSDNSNKSVTK